MQLLVLLAFMPMTKSILSDFRLAISDEVLTELGQRLRKQRLARDMTQAELSARADVALSSIKALESTGRTTMDTFVRIVQTLNLIHELQDLLLLRPTLSIAAIERAERAIRKRASRRQGSR